MLSDILLQILLGFLFWIGFGLLQSENKIRKRIGLIILLFVIFFQFNKASKAKENPPPNYEYSPDYERLSR